MLLQFVQVLALFFGVCARESYLQHPVGWLVTIMNVSNSKTLRQVVCRSRLLLATDTSLLTRALHVINVINGLLL